MKCPVDDTTLQMTEREGVEIDYCPDCRGIWLDRGELDRILERAAARESVPAPSAASRADDHKEHPDPKPKPKKNRLSFLSDLLPGGEED